MRALISIAVALVALLGLAVRGQNLQSGQVFGEPPAPARDAARELAMKVTGPFTVAAVGDVMIKRPASMRADAAFQNAIRLLRDADIAVGNMEGNLSDLPRFEGPLRGMMGSKEVAADLKAMGFDLMNRANNHIFDADKEGMLATIEQLDAAGIVHAGTGRNLEDARAPAYLDTAKGRIAIVGMHTPHNTAQANASYQSGNVGGRPGLNALNYETFHHVTTEQLDALKKRPRGGVHGAARHDEYGAAAARSNSRSRPAVRHLVQGRDAGHEELRDGPRRSARASCAASGTARRCRTSWWRPSTRTRGRSPRSSGCSKTRRPTS